MRRSAATGASQRHGERMNDCGQRAAEVIAAVAKTTASAIQTIRLSVRRAEATSSTSKAAPSASATFRRCKPIGAGAISVSSNGAVSTTYVEYGPTPLCFSAGSQPSGDRA